MKALTLTLALSFQLHLALAGGAVGNGGDTVYCQPDSKNAFVGWYSLDYIVNKLNGMEFAEDFEKVVGPNDPADHNFVRLMRVLSSYPIIANELKQFHDLLYSNQYHLRYVWKKAPYGVVEVNDELLRIKVPPNCLSEKGNVIQTIIRETKPWGEITIIGPDGRRRHYDGVNGANFTYSNQAMSEMSPLQVSFLLFHEWLRNLTDDPETLRDLNAIFHSLGWEENPEAKLELIKKFRLERLTSLKYFAKDPFAVPQPLNF